MTPEQIGRYSIISLIGHGGMGIVYLAHDPHIDRQVAIKLLPSQFLSEAKYRERFQREARTIARLDHPVIVPVYDFGEHEEQPFIVMRYMAGGSLVEWTRHGKLPMQTAVSIIHQYFPFIRFSGLKRQLGNDNIPQPIAVKIPSRDKGFIKMGTAFIGSEQEFRLAIDG